MIGIDSGNTAIFPKTQKPQRRKGYRGNVAALVAACLGENHDDHNFRVSQRTRVRKSPGKLDAAEDNEAHGYRSEHPHEAVNILGRRASKKERRRLRRGNEKRREAEVSCAIFAHVLS
ncbi:hypothetical protein FJ434_00575 [Mesorhizobium sp. B2-5-13]|uniref:hypothetical protein n=1 Tax=unclassified Mesorhizobium TaxID=325217 RepID=UPI001126F136|nr:MULTISPECIES: hypothetical protein [unclassified Mesorhizobium]TPJ43588.1 hypothetical protein FJ432_06620 [Mesorhizobium sp. B2-6-5]TPJ93232.1 hypothetical protein FJ434_00575 [Mesorhizobium sp. B2-5-13]TPK47084.1 hypothetical protein FJ560_17715 [Mesorhizobium sp. B2-5-5]